MPATIDADTVGATADLPLAGTRVVELGQNIAGPYAGEILALLGADVLKVERPEGGDDARSWGPPFVNGMAAAFHAINTNKRSVALDLRDPQALAWLKRTIAEADVLVHNMRPGVLEPIGLDSATLMALNPRLVYCSLSAYGHAGPMQMRPGYEPMVQAFSGMWSTNGDENGPPSRVGMPALDVGSGMWGALGCLAALHRRHATGKGGVVQGSLLETAMGYLGVLLAGFQVTGVQQPRHRSGSPSLVVFQSFETSDSEILVGAANDRLFAKLVTALGQPQWAKDGRFASNADRVLNKADLLGPMATIFRSASTQAWSERLEAAGVPCAPVNDFRQASDDAQVRAIGICQPVPDVDLQVVGLPISFDGVRPPIARGAPALGEFNADLPQGRSDAKTGASAWI